MALRPYPDSFRGRISFPRHVVISGELTAVYDQNDFLTHWLIKSDDRDSPTMVPAAAAIVEPSFKLNSNAPRGKKRGR